jgi:hypothetical protein
MLGVNGLGTFMPGNNGLGTGIFRGNSLIFNGFRDGKDGIGDRKDGLGNRLDTALSRVRTAEKQNRGQPSSNGSRNKRPHEREPLPGGSAGRGSLPRCGSPNGIPAGSELLKDSLGKRSLLRLQLVLDYFFPVLHHCCSFK